MPSYELEPLEGGNRVKLSDKKITIGRGPFLQVTDKRVSRNHATLEIVEGQLILTPIHTNPCFFKSLGKGEKCHLKKDAPKVLKHADVFGLLPDKLFYKVIAKGLENGKNSRQSKNETETKSPKAGRVKMKMGNSQGDMALPVEKARVLPRWMKGASKRVDVGGTTKPQPTPTKRQTAASVRTPKRKAPTRAEASESPRKRGTTKRRAQEPSNSEEEEEEEEERTPGRRAGRRASQATKYTDDFVLSEEEIEFSDDETAEQKRRGRHKESSDEEFKMEEESSASDWEEERQKPSRSVKAAKKGAGRRGNRRRSSGGATRRSNRTSSKRRKRYAESDSDDFDDIYDDEDNYIPRPSRRRGGRVKEESEEEEEEEDSPPAEQRKKTKREPRPSCMYGRKCYRKNPNHFTEFCHPGDASYDEDEAAEAKAEYKSDASSAEESEKSDKSEKEEKEEKEEEEEEKTDKKPLREKDKKSVLHKASDDDGEPNTYDYDDSFIADTRKRRHSDSDGGAGDSGDLSESEEEDVKRLVKEARGFLRNKKAQKV